MTTRFSVADLADMMHTSVTAVRAAIEELADLGELTGESFEFGDRNWRIAPSDTKRIQAKVLEMATAAPRSVTSPSVPRRIKRKEIRPPMD